MNKYWENPPDVEIDTEKNVLRYYKQAGKLQISMPKWTDKDGTERQGKTVVLNLDSLRETAGAVGTLLDVLSEIA